MNTRKQLTEAEIVGDYAAIRGQITQILLPMERCEKGKHLIQPLAGTTLGIVYAVDLPGESPMKRKLIPITWTMVETWGVPLTELLQTAEDNRLTIRRPLVMPIDEILREAGTEIPSCPLLVVTNECRSYGAVSITYPEIQEQVRAWYSGKDFFVLPSSVHETICVPADVGTPEGLLAMVSDVNRSLLPGDYLARDVYRVEGGHLRSIAAVSQEKLPPINPVIPDPDEELFA